MSVYGPNVVAVPATPSTEMLSFIKARWSRPERLQGVRKWPCSAYHTDARLPLDSTGLLASDVPCDVLLTMPIPARNTRPRLLPACVSMCDRPQLSACSLSWVLVALPMQPKVMGCNVPISKYRPFYTCTKQTIGGTPPTRVKSNVSRT